MFFFIFFSYTQFNYFYLVFNFQTIHLLPPTSHTSHYSHLSPSKPPTIHTSHRSHLPPLTPLTIQTSHHSHLPPLTPLTIQTSHHSHLPPLTPLITYSTSSCYRHPSVHERCNSIITPSTCLEALS